MTIELIYVTFPNFKTEKKCVNILLKKKLIACANSVKMKSTSKWTKKIVSVNEVLTILKTKKGNYKKIKNELEQVHPYIVPCILKINAESNTKYEKWVKEETALNK